MKKFILVVFIALFISSMWASENFLEKKQDGNLQDCPSLLVCGDDCCLNGKICCKQNGQYMCISAWFYCNSTETI